MARSREEIVSEMVDSGLFSDDEIRQAVGQQAKPQGLAGKAWGSLAVPEKMSREGLQMIAQSIPEQPIQSQSTPLNVIGGLPRFAVDTMAEAAPSFISRGSIVTAGLLKGLKSAARPLKAIGRSVARGAESISGLEYKTPGVLLQAAKDPTLISAEGTKKAGALFKDLIEKGRIRESFSKASGHKEILDDAMKAINDGSLTPEEALIARQSLDAIKKTMPRFSFQKMRDAFDAVAKTKSAQADAAFSRGVKADALRMLLPVNKGGGTSIAKSTLGTIAGAGPLALMSPLVQGVAATVIGATSRGGSKLASEAIRSGAMTGAIREAFLKALQRRKEKQNAK